MTRKTIIIIVFGDQAKNIEERLGLERVGDITDINTKIFFEKMKAEGRRKIKIEFDV